MALAALLMRAHHQCLHRSPQRLIIGLQDAEDPYAQENHLAPTRRVGLSFRLEQRRAGSGAQQLVRRQELDEGLMEKSVHARCTLHQQPEGVTKDLDRSAGLTEPSNVPGRQRTAEHVLEGIKARLFFSSLRRSARSAARPTI